MKNSREFQNFYFENDVVRQVVIALPRYKVAHFTLNVYDNMAEGEEP